MGIYRTRIYSAGGVDSKNPGGGVRSVCIVPTHPDGQDCDILRYCALFSILNGALRLAMAHRPPDLVALFRAVSNPCWCGMVRPDRRPSRCVSWLLSLLHCPGHTQQEIADAVGVDKATVNRRLEECCNLDKCPKSNKIAFISSISRPIFCRRCKKSWRDEIA